MIASRREVVRVGMTSVALALGGAVPGAMAAYAAARQAPQDGVRAGFPYRSRYASVYGSRMHYVDEGAGEPILFIHGNPAWSYLWRNVLPHVIPVARCVSVDHIGMGLSDKPDLAYTFFQHVAYLERFIDATGLERFTLAVHDWGAALGLALAVRHPDRIRAVALLESFSINGQLPAEYASADPSPWGPPVRAWVNRFVDPEEGAALVMEQDKFLDPVLPMLTKRTFTEAELAGYKRPYETPASRRAMWRWPHNLPQYRPDVRDDFAWQKQWLETTDVPKLVFYSSQGMITNHEIRWYQEQLRNVDTVYVGEAYHYVQEDQPDAIGRGLAEWFTALK